MSVQVLTGDALEMLRTLPADSVQCCVTSPPYWGLRDYGVAGQLGLELTPENYVARMVEVFREVRRVLRPDGVLWLNLGDSYVTKPRGNREGDYSTSSLTNPARQEKLWGKHKYRSAVREPRGRASGSLKEKDLIGIPWMVAFALRADGWYLRSEIIWHKPNPMPKSVTDRPTKSHEQIFLLTKSPRYFYDADAIAEPASYAMQAQMEQGYNGNGTKAYAESGVQNPSDVKRRIIENAQRKSWKGSEFHTGKTGIHQLGRSSKKRGEFAGKTKDFTGREAFRAFTITRNKRTVWKVPPQPYRGAHFATFSTKLIEPCILAGSRVGDLVLDPFAGSGTTGQVALQHGREALLIELNPDYVRLIEQRLGIQTEAAA